jgi:hypothetical protein
MGDTSILGPESEKDPSYRGPGGLPIPDPKYLKGFYIHNIYIYTYNISIYICVCIIYLYIYTKS